ncbi:MAG: hypothetical protein HYX63_17090 [Gammaproteobacteria bacterium]|nr:hypothetical protein [Gammaproteobacteria bacterium]
MPLRFLKSSAARGATGCLLIFSWWLAAAAAPLEVKLAYIGAINSSAHQGALQGLEEAQQQGDFLGQHYTLVELAAVADPIDASAVIAALPAVELVAVAAAHPTLPVFNVTRPDDALRTQCKTNLLHVIPNTKTLVDALAQWRVAHPEAKTVQAQAWHADFEKYSASQLNNRYREKFKQPMDDAAWAGWAAVKLLSDLAAREQSADPAVLLKALREHLAFDGQKGVTMSFRDNGQLRQPVLLVDHGKVVGEAPVRGVVEVEDLDSLGQISCAK